MARRRSSLSGWWRSSLEIVGALSELAGAEVSGMEAELKLVVVTARRALVWAVVTAVLATFTVGVLLSAAIAGLSVVMPVWGASLSVAAVLLVALAVTVRRSRLFLQELESPVEVVRRRVDDHVRWWQQEVVRQVEPPGTRRASLDEWEEGEES